MNRISILEIHNQDLSCLNTQMALESLALPLSVCFFLSNCSKTTVALHRLLLYDAFLLGKGNGRERLFVEE